MKYLPPASFDINQLSRLLS